MLAEGRSQAEIAKALGLAKSTVAYHARRTVPAEAKFRRRYDWAEVQRYYDEGHSITDCQRHFGFARKTATDACRRGDLVTRPQAMAIEELLVVGRPTKRWHLRLRLLSAGLKENRCEACGLTEWLGRPLSMQLHHRNGDGLDNRLENLALLCPNCHSQTDTWGGRNRGGAERRRARMANHPGSSTIAEGGSGDRGPNRPSAYSVATHPLGR
jgi:5-methylcytosine-specific restriction endonuclease McrA